MAFEIDNGGGNPTSEGSRYRRKEQSLVAFAPGEKPHDIPTERAVLAGLILSTDAMMEVQNFMQASHFFLPAHQDIYNAMIQLGFKGTPVDLTTLAGYLRDEGKLELIGGLSYLSEIISTPSTSLHAVDYARHVEDLAWRRRMLEAAENCRAAALKPGDTREIASEIEKSIFAATQERKTSHLQKIGDLLPDAIKEFERRADHKGIPENSVQSGLTDLDEQLSGFRPGQLVVLAARPGMGKTSLAANMICNAGIKHHKNVLFFSLEMTQQEVVERIMAQTANIDLGKLRNGNLSHKDFNNLFHAADEIGAAPLFIDDRSIISPYDVLATARKLNSQLHLVRADAQIDLIVVDYIQIMKSGGRVENRALEVAAITGGLKAIAKDLKVPVLALSQLNREGAKRPNESRRPQLSDLKDSGAIEADADVVLFIHREFNPDQDSRAPAEAEIIVAKQRSGPTGIIKVTWLGHLTQFSNFIHESVNYSSDQNSGPSGMPPTGPPVSYDF